MLKDLFNRNKNPAEKILKSIADGYVDIKIYEYNKDKTEKKMVYHDTGDNTVTDWMRQAIIQLLAGYPFTKAGRTDPEPDKGLSGLVTKPVTGNHGADKNTDGYVFGVDGAKYKESLRDANMLSCIHGEKHVYSIYPTKVLLGTGKEYSSWEQLKSENEIANSEWYSEKVEWYSNGATESEASTNFDDFVSCKINSYSATVGTQNNYSGTGNIIPCITVNNPESEINNSTPIEMSKRYGVVGAIKTAYLPDKTIKFSSSSNTEVSPEEILNPIVSDSGKLIKPIYRGIGYPCFIYFKRNYKSTSDSYDWGDRSSAGVSLSKDSSGKYLNKITFRIVMPAQEDDEYYPYNGWTLRQIGLFNDSYLILNDETDSYSPSTNMPCGMMLAVKNIQSFTKTCNQEVNFTWTLTI